MSASRSFLIIRFDEFVPRGERAKVPHNTRGIYILLKRKGRFFNVIYAGMAAGDKSGVRSRLKAHARSKRKASAWD